MLVIRSAKPFFHSKPGIYLLLTTLLILPVALCIPFIPGIGIVGFSPLPLRFLGFIALIIAGYIVVAELAKKVFYAHVKI